MRYGTSGFRDHHKNIITIAKRIGVSISRLVDREEKSYGIMITASHNHCDDNGVKIMDEHGDMVSNDVEKYLENFVNQKQFDVAWSLGMCNFRQNGGVRYSTYSPLGRHTLSGLVWSNVS